MQPITPATAEEVRRRWAVRDADRPKRPPPRPSVNMQPVLDLGGMEWITFHGRAYGVGVLPWRQGERILHWKLLIQGMGEEIHPDNMPAYFDAMGKLADAVWDNLVPYNKWEKRLKKWGLAKKITDGASEFEIAELANFCLARRTKSSIQNRSDSPARQEI